MTHDTWPPPHTHTHHPHIWGMWRRPLQWKERSSSQGTDIHTHIRTSRLYDWIGPVGRFSENVTAWGELARLLWIMYLTTLDSTTLKFNNSSCSNLLFNNLLTQQLLDTTNKNFNYTHLQQSLSSTIITFNNTFNSMLLTVNPTKRIHGLNKPWIQQ